MTPFGESHRYQEQIGAFLLGKLDAGELEAMQAHLDSCPGCQAEVRELEPVVAGLADAVPDRIDENPWPPGDLEESTLAPILGEIQRTRSRRQQFQWSALAAAAICVVVLGLAAFTWLAEPGVALEQLSISGERPGVKVEGDLIAYDDGGTEIRLDASGLQYCQTYKVTLVSDGEQVNVGTLIGTGDKTVGHTFDTKLSREDVTRLEVRTPGGELEFFAELPEEPRVENGDKPRWADSNRPNKGSETCGPKNKEGSSAEEEPPPDKQEKPKDDGSGGGTPDKESSPQGDGERVPPGDEKPGPEPDGSGPGGGSDENPPDDQPPDVPDPPDPCDLPPDERSPDDDQYNPNTGSEC